MLQIRNYVQIVSDRTGCQYGTAFPPPGTEIVSYALRFSSAFASPDPSRWAMYDPAMTNAAPA